MVDEMLIAQAQWLPQYKKQIPAIKKRFGKEKKLGTHKGKGAARLKTRSISEMRKTGAQRRVADGKNTIAADDKKKTTKRKAKAKK
ncbi:MAG: hypothetical protein ACOCX4_02345, partial [Planctomycetota bacterium]